jgi:hypothetical protein
MVQLSKQTLHYRLLVFLIIAASCLRIFVCFQHNPLHYLASDMQRHWDDGVSFPVSGAADPILYQVYIFILSKLAGHSTTVIALASALLSVLMPWTYYRAARNFGLSKLPSLWVWALIAWTPSLLVIYHYIMMETLLLLLEGVALWMTTRYLRKKTSGAFLDCIFCWTLACLTKPTVVPLAAICILWCCWKKVPSLRTATIAAAMVIILLLPSAIRSKMELGFIAPFGNSWFIKIQHRSGARAITLHYYTHPNAFDRSAVSDRGMESISPSCYVLPFWPLSDWRLRRASGNSRTIVFVNSLYGERDWKDAYGALNISRKEWLRQWGENIVFFFFAPSWPESMVPEWDGKLELWARWMWAPLIMFVIVCNFREFLRRRFDLLPVAGTLFTLFLALQNVVTFEGRYRKPLETLLLLNLVWVLTAQRARHRNKHEPATLESSQLQNA